MPILQVLWPEITAITPFVIGELLAIELATSFLLTVMFRSDGRVSLLILSSASLYSGLMAITHLLTFPGAIVPGHGLLGTSQSVGWQFNLWMNGYAALVLGAILLEISGVHSPPRQRTLAIVLMVLLSVTTTVLASLVVIVFASDMPPMLQRASWTAVNDLGNYALLSMLALSIGLVWWQVRAAPFLWLALALSALFVANVMSLSSGARYSVGWYAARLSWICSACVFFLFFMRLFATQQRTLAAAKDTLEAIVAQRTADLQATIKQRDLLLREVYHRVKNNLQVIDALMMMEQRRLTDQTAHDALDDLRNRVYALGLVHQQLMVAENFATVDMAEFLPELVTNVATSLTEGIDVQVECDALWMDLDTAIPVGLVTTELVINAVKHAKSSTIIVKLHQSDHQAKLVVSDNGSATESGHPCNHMGDQRLNLSTSVGSKIIDGLTRQLNGQMKVFMQGGMTVEITLPWKPL
jgi:two-component sensor histidine kinase